MTGPFRVVVVFALAVVLCAAAPPAPTTAPQAPPFKYITVITVVDELGLPKKMVRADLYFVGDTALMVDADGIPEWSMDLARQTISDDHGTRKSLAQMRADAEKQRADSLKQLAAYKDAAAAERMKSELDPALTVSEEQGKLIISNPVIRYEITPASLEARYRQRLYLAVRLGAYVRASAGSPPFLNLALNDEMEHRGQFAREMKVVHQTSDGPVEMHVQARVLPLSEQDRKRLAPLFLPGAGF